MNKLSNKIIRLITLIVFWAVTGAFLVVSRHYLPAAFCLMPLILVSYKLYRLNLRTTNQFKQFADSIQFSESNISFSNTVCDDTYRAYYNSLERALNKINLQTQKREADISFYNILLNRIDFALIIVDRAGNIVWINKPALDMLGRPKPVDLEAIKKGADELKKVFESLQPKISKTLRLETEGKIRNLIVNLSTISIRGEEFNIYSLKDVQMIVDKTEDIAWQQLIQVLTHEIMNSLTPIISLSESLSKDRSDTELLSKAMETIHRRSKGLVSFINNYKQLTQISVPQYTHIKIKALVDDITRLMKGHGIELQTLITSDSLTLYADRAQIEQVLINLIKNAQESCSDITNPMIKLTVTNDANNLIVMTVSDNGSGMEANVLQKIFTPFYTTKPHGSGIGLSICRQIVTIHGGTLVASSKLGEGSVFTIRI